MRSTFLPRLNPRHRPIMLSLFGCRPVKRTNYSVLTAHIVKSDGLDVRRGNLVTNTYDSVCESSEEREERERRESERGIVSGEDLPPVALNGRRKQASALWPAINRLTI